MAQLSQIKGEWDKSLREQVNSGYTEIYGAIYCSSRHQPSWNPNPNTADSVQLHVFPTKSKGLAPKYMNTKVCC